MVFENWGATEAEQLADMPGDELLVDPSMSATRSVSLRCPPDQAIDWLAQMGTGRAGWYSYDLIDNFGRRSARRLNPSWRVERVGDLMPAGPISFEVKHLTTSRVQTGGDRRPASTADGAVPADELVIAVLDRTLAGHRIDFTLAYRAEAEGPGNRCRLVSRARANVAGPLSAPANLALAIGDGFMVRRQLLGLQERCG